MAQELLKAGANYRCPELEYGGRILFWAEYDNNVELTRAALAAKVDPMICIPDQESLLIHAISRGHEEIAKELLTVDQNTEFKDFDGMTAMAHAVISKSLAIVTVLAEARADVNVREYNWRTPLLFAAACGDTRTVNIQIEAGAYVNAPDMDGNSALIIAARNGDLDCVRALIRAKAEIEVYNYNGETALMVAVFHGKVEVVQELLNAGADVHAHGPENHTALFFAPTAEVADALIAAHADVNARDQMDCTALMVASQLRRSDVVTRLLEARAVVNTKDFAGMSALLYSLRIENERLPVNERIVQTLLTANAHVSGADEYGNGALHLAVRNCHQSASLLQLLLETCQHQVKSGVDVNARTRIGTTAPMRAVLHDPASLAALLVDRDDIDTRDSNGFTALIKAACKVNTRAVKLLLDAGARWDPMHPAEINAFVDTCRSDYNRDFPYRNDDDHEDCVEKPTRKNVSDEDVVEVLQLLIAAKADVNQKVPGYFTPLMAAVERPEVVRVLLKAGADVDGQARDGRTALMIAVAAEAPKARESVQLLVGAKADVNAIDFDHVTALKHAVSEGDIATVRVLVAAGAQADLGYSDHASPLKETSRPEMVRLLLEGKADVQKLLYKHDTVPLESDVLDNNVEVMKLLVDAGLDLSHTIKLAATLLSSAAARGHADMLRLLMDAKAPVDAVNPNRSMKTPLSTAITADRVSLDTVKVLLAAGARIDACGNEFGKPALWLEEVLKNAAVLKCLLQALCHQTGYLQPLEKVENMSDDASVTDKEDSG